METIGSGSRVRLGIAVDFCPSANEVKAGIRHPALREVIGTVLEVPCDRSDNYLIEPTAHSLTSKAGVVELPTDATVIIPRERAIELPLG